MSSIAALTRNLRLRKKAERDFRPTGQAMNPEFPFQLRSRILVGLAIGLISGVICFLLLTHSTEDNWAGDFSWPYLGAKYLLNGENPYEGKYPRTDPLFYPLPALFAAIPFTPFPPEIAGALFIAFSTGILGFAVTRYGFTYLPLFISAPFLMTLITAQWAPLLLAAAFLPVLLPLVIAKPSLGAALLVTWPDRYAIAAIVAMGLISLVIQPTWPFDWLESLRATSHPSAVLVFAGGGPLILLALACWRLPEARFLLLMALIPQRLFFYDQLLLWLVVKSTRQSLYFALTSWLGFLGWVSTSSVDQVANAEPWVVVSIFVPATVIVLWNGRREFEHWISRFRTSRGASEK